MEKAKNISEKVLHAALGLAAEKPWQDISMHEIAVRADIEMADIHDIFTDKIDILVAFGRSIDRQVIANCGTPDQSEPIKDRLFEVLMERFDFIQEHRLGVLSILNSMKSDPKAALISLPHLKHSMMWMMEAAGIHSTGLRGAAQLLTLTVLYLRVVYVWREDDSIDMAKTMAALDKGLSRFSDLSERFN